MSIPSFSTPWLMLEKRKTSSIPYNQAVELLLHNYIKHKVIYDHFLQHIGTYIPRQCALNLSNLGWSPKHLQHLEDPFSEAEFKKVIQKAPKEKAPDPDGFIGLFFSSCWEIIKFDLI
jgi:hypothetical protein